MADEIRARIHVDHHLADYAMAFDMISKIAGVTTEHAVIDKIFDFFSVLCAPGELVYLTFIGGKPGALIVRPDTGRDRNALQEHLLRVRDASELTDSGKGFILRVQLEKDLFGIFEVDNVAFPQHLPHYVSLSAHLASGIALAVANARYFERIQTEIAERKLTEESVHRQNLILSGINRIFQEALSERTEEELGEVCLGVAEEITGSRFGFIGEIGADNLLHDIAISNPGWDACAIYDKTEQRKPPGNFHIRGFYGKVVKDGKPFFTNEPSSHPDSVGLPAGHPALTSLLVVPLLRRGRVTGVITLGNREKGYSDEMLKAIEALSPAVVEAFERKRTEETIRTSEERFRAFFELAAVGAAEADPVTGRFVRVNDSFCELLGYPREEFLTKTIRDVTHPDDRERDVIYVDKIVKGKLGNYNVEKRYIHKSGRTIWGHLSASVVRDDRGRPVRLTGIIEDITARKQMEEEITHLAHHDALTGLPNRRLFRDITEVELAQAHRNRSKLAILFLDLDRFKEINDTLGHDAGDELLKQAAALFKDTIRSSDTVARIGGDEFNIILADIVRPEDVSDVAQKIVRRFRTPFSVSANELSVTTSIGISVYPDDSTEIDTLLRYADIAMYHAKESGRNTYRFYNPAINVRSIERMRMTNMLRKSIDSRELVMHYQPQIDIRTSRMVCAEALVRWQHPEKGLLTPGQFLAQAEETGFIADIDQWALKTVCEQVRSWIESGLPPVCVTVNLSARQFEKADFAERISSIMHETRMEPDCLDLEVTERTAMNDVERTASKLRELREMGVHVSIDDFGTGYSSLNYLKKLPIERLKIDKSFILDIANDPDDRAIISAVTSMAHKMGIRTVAEGVETEEQLSFLRSVECDEAQGFLISRPVPEAEFRALIGSR